MSWDVVHWKVVHVSLNELQSLILDHLDSVLVKHGRELLDVVSAKTLALLAGLIEGKANNVLDIVETLDALTHAQAEVSEPLVVEGNGPVLTEELHCVWNDSVVESVGQLVEIVLVEANETPQTLQDDLLITHVSHRVNQSN